MNKAVEKGGFFAKKKQDEDSLSFGELLLETEASGTREGEISKGIVLSIKDDQALIDIGGKSEGRIDLSEFRALDGTITLAVGDEVEVFVVALEDDYGQCRLSKREADRMKMWEEIAGKVERDELVLGLVIGRVKGGLQVDIGVKAFLPGSQVELRPSRNLDKFIGQSFEFKIIKFNKKRGNIVLSRRALLEDERERQKRKTLERLVEGSILDGVVKNITEYGAFVDLGGIDGLLHITDMSWGRVTHPEEVVRIGDELRVKVLKFNRESERVSLGLKQLQADPWSGAEDRYPANVQVLGKVVSMIDYGAFVELEEGIEGLVHISELAERHVEIPEQIVQVGDEIFVKVIDIDLERRRISLSLKQANESGDGEVADEFDPYLYGMAPAFDEGGNYVGPDGFDPETGEWKAGYEDQRAQWEREYAEAHARWEAHRKQASEMRTADAEQAVAEGTATEYSSASAEASGALASDESLQALRDKLAGDS
jgi:small subunit ribosomal protein S1